MTTVVCALVGPVMTELPRRPRRRACASSGITCPVEIMESSGGVMSAARAARAPGAHGRVRRRRRASSRPASWAAPPASTTSSRSTWAARRPRRASCATVGPAIAHDFQVGGKGSFGGARAGTGVPAEDPGRRPRRGRRRRRQHRRGSTPAARCGSARARPAPMPGPACYGRGGTEPTVTDANLVLGYLDPDGLAGGVTLSARRWHATRSTHGGGAARARRWSTPPGPCTTSSTRAWRPRSGSSPSSAASTPATSCSSGSAAPGPMHVARLADDVRHRDRRRAVGAPASPPPSAWSAPTSASTWCRPT